MWAQAVFACWAEVPGVDSRTGFTHRSFQPAKSTVWQVSGKKGSLRKEVAPWKSAWIGSCCPASNVTDCFVDKLWIFWTSCEKCLRIVAHHARNGQIWTSCSAAASCPRPPSGFAVKQFSGGSLCGLAFPKLTCLFDDCNLQRCCFSQNVPFIPGASDK